MFHLTPIQLRGLSATADASFDERVAQRVAQRFATHAKALGDTGHRQAVADALQRGRSHGLVSEGDLFLFVCLAFVFGPTFDDDASLPWAGATLRSRVLGTPAQRLARTHALALVATAKSGRPWVALPAAAA